MKLSVPDSWGTWNDPPFSEDSAPEVLYSNLFSSLAINFSSPVFAFGFEAQPGLSATELLSAYFSRAGAERSVSRDVSGNAGALLFAMRRTFRSPACSSSIPAAMISESRTCGSRKPRFRNLVRRFSFSWRSADLGYSGWGDLGASFRALARSR